MGVPLGPQAVPFLGLLIIGFYSSIFKNHKEELLSYLGTHGQQQCLPH